MVKIFIILLLTSLAPVSSKVYSADPVEYNELAPPALVQAPMSSAKPYWEYNLYSSDSFKFLDKKKWKSISMGRNVAWFYNKDIIHEPNGITAAWVKILTTPYGAKEYQNLYNNYEKIDNISMLVQLKCQSSKYREIEFIIYDDDGHQLESISNSQKNTEWSYIVPDSYISTLKNSVCTGTRAKNKK